MLAYPPLPRQDGSGATGELCWKGAVPFQNEEEEESDEDFDRRRKHWAGDRGAGTLWGLKPYQVLLTPTPLQCSTVRARSYLSEPHLNPPPERGSRERVDIRWRTGPPEGHDGQLVRTCARLGLVWLTHNGHDVTPRGLMPRPLVASSSSCLAWYSTISNYSTYVHIW